MNLVCRTIGIIAVSLAAAFSVYAQETTKPTTQSQGTQPAATSNQTDTYTFPSNRERFRKYVKDTVGPFRLARTGVTAGLDQWSDKPPEWGQGMKGYGKRFASGLGQNAIQQTVTYGLDEAMGLDTGFKRSTREGFFPRLKDALLENVTSRTKSGKRVVSVPRFAGVYAGAVIATETWYPERYSYKDGLRHGTKNLLTSFGINIVREFVFNF
jgi:hypothetical protein